MSRLICHHKQLQERHSKLFCLLKMANMIKNNAESDSDDMTCNAASNLGLHRLLMPHL